jgi:phage replication initiation protein
MSFTTIDWLGFRTQAEPIDCVDALRPVFGELAPLLRSTPKKKGLQGYQISHSLSLDRFHIGDMSFGGDAMRGWVWVELSGQGCQWIPDWDVCEDHISQLKDFQYKRVDIALDTFKGETSHEKVLQAHQLGQFTTSGKPPSLKQIVPADPCEGRTIYVGKRDQPKYLRAYEKGYEQAAKTPALEITHIEGVPVGDWYRLELELKAKNQLLPEDLIENRDQFFAGAYPYLQTMIDAEPQVLRLSRDKGPQRALAGMLAQLKTQYGNTLFSALMAYHGDIGAVWQKIVGHKHNDRLLDAGILLVDHD